MPPAFGRSTPAEAAAYRAAEAAAAAALPLAERRRLRVRNNLLRVRPDWDAARIRRAVRRSFEESARYYVDLARLARTPARRVLDERLRTAGIPRLELALARGEGAILAAPHIATPEAAMAGLAALGISATALIEPPRDSRQLRLVQALRDRGPAKFAFADAKGTARVLRELREGGVACILWDRDVQRPLGGAKRGHANPTARFGGVCVPFFGRQAHFPVGAVDIALRTGAPLLPVSISRRRHFSFDVEIHDPLELIRTENRALDIRTGVADLARFFEPIIQERCEQWRMPESPWAPCRDAPPTAPQRPKSIV